MLLWRRGPRSYPTQTFTWVQTCKLPAVTLWHSCVRWLPGAKKSPSRPRWVSNRGAMTLVLAAAAKNTSTAAEGKRAYHGPQAGFCPPPRSRGVRFPAIHLPEIYWIPRGPRKIGDFWGRAGTTPAPAAAAKSTSIAAEGKTRTTAAGGIPPAACIFKVRPPVLRICHDCAVPPSTKGQRLTAEGRFPPWPDRGIRRRDRFAWSFGQTGVRGLPAPMGRAPGAFW